MKHAIQTMCACLARARQTMRSALRRMVSPALRALVLLCALATFTALVFLIGYILVRGIPHLQPSLFAWEYNSDNVSMLPAILATLEMTGLSLLICVPLGVFTAVYLVEYARRGSRLVKVIRMTAETLAGIPSIVFGLFGMLFFVTFLHWNYSVLAGAMTLSIMVLPSVMRTTEEAMIAVPGERHLYGLKELLYENPYENPHRETEYPGFRFVGRTAVRGEIRVPDSQTAVDLFTMTPYYWKTGPQAAQRLETVEGFSTEIGFDFLLYQRQ